MIKPNYNEMMQTDSKAVIQTLANDPAFVRELVQQALNTALEAEMTELLGAAKSERTGARRGYRSGSYPRSLSMKVGTVELKVPQDRDGRFSTEVFERYQRSEKALVSTLAEMYVKGVSTRKVGAMAERLCGHEFSATTISNMVAALDQSLTACCHGRVPSPAPDAHPVPLPGSVPPTAAAIPAADHRSGTTPSDPVPATSHRASPAKSATPVVLSDSYLSP